MPQLQWPHGACLAVLLALMPAVAAAENEGLDDLDKAIEQKLNVRNLKDLSATVDRLQAALNKGLDDQNTDFAQQLLGDALLERATILTETLTKRAPSMDAKARMRLWAIAVADVKRALQLHAKSPRAELLLGRLQALAGKRKEAIDALSACIDSTTDEQTEIRARALALRGTLQTDKQQRKADLDRAIELLPDRAEALRARAELLQELGQDDAALADLKRAIELAPKAAEAYAERAQIRLRKGQLKQALEDLDQAIQINPRAGVLLALRANLRLLAGDSDGAATDVDKALQLQPGFLPALRLRAEILAHQEKIAEAIASLKPLAEARPDDQALQIQLGRYYLANHQADQAIASFNKQLEKTPDNAEILRLRGDAYLALGQQAEAIVDYQAALKIDPENSGLLNNLAWVLATSPNKELRDGSEAVRLATKACATTKYKQPHILSTLAASYAETGDFEKAVEWSQKAVDLGKDSPQAAQLKQELESYHKKKPWRELQSDETSQPTDPPEAKGQAAPAPPASNNVTSDASSPPGGKQQ